MTNKLFIGSLPYDTTDAQLSEHFAASGTVLSAKVITDRDTGQGKGFGFVEMSTSEEAREAIKTLNGTSLSGRSILVNEAKPQIKRDNNNQGHGGNRDNNRQRGNRW